MEEDALFMKLALDQAKLSLLQDQLPVGAIILVNGELRSIGRKSKPGNKRLDHAETMALRDALRIPFAKTDFVTVYSTLEPCTMCFGTLLNCGVSRVVYALEDPYDGGTGIAPAALPVRHRSRFPLIERHVLREESRALFERYFATTKSEFWTSHPDNPLYQIVMDKPPTNENETIACRSLVLPSGHPITYLDLDQAYRLHGPEHLLAFVSTVLGTLPPEDRPLIMLAHPSLVGRYAAEFAQSNWIAVILYDKPIGFDASEEPTQARLLGDLLGHHEKRPHEDLTESEIETLRRYFYYGDLLD